MKTEFAHQYSIYMACSGEKVIKPITLLRKIPCNECQILETLQSFPKPFLGRPDRILRREELQVSKLFPAFRLPK